MAYKKTHPGLDQVVTDEALQAFVEPPRPLEEPPVRRWPTHVLIAVAANTVGVVVGRAVASSVTWLELVLVVVAVVSGAVAFGCHEYRLREGDC